MEFKQKNREISSFIEHEENVFKDLKRQRAQSKRYKIKDSEKAADLIRESLNGPIVIVGDYDADGITSTTEMLIGLRCLGAADVTWHIPRRMSEGYGFSPKIWEQINEVRPKPGLLITVDNGISASEPIRMAKEKGWKTLIMDHHPATPDDEGNITLPEPDVLIDPNAVEKSASFKDYCGAGLVYKLFQQEFDLPEEEMSKIIGLAAIGTICDSVNLVIHQETTSVYDNWLITKKGLAELGKQSARTAGLAALMGELKLDGQPDSEGIAFTLGPAMNAPGRLKDDGASEVVSLILEDKKGQDPSYYRDLRSRAASIVALNDERKKLTETQAEAAISEIKSSNMQDDFPIVYAAKPGNLHEGIAGIIAARICEEFGTMAIALCDDGNGILKGSARAPEGTNIKELLNSVNAKNPELILNYGGHAQAAGITIKSKDLDVFRDTANNLAGEKPELTFLWDFDVKNSEEAGMLAHEIQKYEPYGTGHEKPIFRFKDFPMKSSVSGSLSFLGSAGKVAKITGKGLDALCFKGTQNAELSDMPDGSIMDLYGCPAVNSFRGKERVQFCFIRADIKLPEDNSQEGQNTSEASSENAEDEGDPLEYMRKYVAREFEKCGETTVTDIPLSA